MNNHPQNGDDIDRDAVKESLIAQSRIAGTLRSPSDLADQLLRDATSLELTGASFEKDCRFYSNVAANAREAALLLQQWQPKLDAMIAEHVHDLDNATRTTRTDCAGVAAEVYGLVGAASSPSADSWRAAAAAIEQTILACARVRG